MYVEMGLLKDCTLYNRKESRGSAPNRLAVFYMNYEIVQKLHPTEKNMLFS